MHYGQLNNGYTITYKYTDGKAIKFRTTPIIKSLMKLNQKLGELDELEMVFESVVNEVKYFDKPERLKEWKESIQED